MKKKMKKQLAIMLAMILGTCCLGGCGDKTAQIQTESATEEAETQIQTQSATEETGTRIQAEDTVTEDGTYTIEATLEGGSGKSTIVSPVTLTVTDGKAVATIRWSSPNYDYMLVDDEKYLPVNTEGNSTFEIPVSVLDEELSVIADTVAMSKPHEIEYTITFHSETLKKADSSELVYEGSMELEYAENFAVDYYKGGYTELTLMDGNRFLVVPEGKDVPSGLDEEVVVLQRPIQNVYLVASAAMDMFRELDAINTIRLSGQKSDGWYIEEARQAMEKGDMLYAGKYSKPDYELILSEGCTLAIENMMVSHSPEVIEKLEGFGIPVMIEYSSYESHPLGRVEWIKLYGALLGKEELAERAFQEQTKILERVTAEEKSNKTVAFFFITSNGMVQVRNASDYVPKMIELAGGKYVPEGLSEEDSKRSTMNIQMEEFYRNAKDADYLIYNSTIDGEITSVKELLDKSELLGDFKAVKEGNVFCTTNDMYQQSMSIGYLIRDIYHMLSQDTDQEMQYLYRLK